MCVTNKHCWCLSYLAFIILLCVRMSLWWNVNCWLCWRIRLKIFIVIIIIIISVMINSSSWILFHRRNSTYHDAFLMAAVVCCWLLRRLYRSRSIHNDHQCQLHGIFIPRKLLTLFLNTGSSCSAVSSSSAIIIRTENNPAIINSPAIPQWQQQHMLEHVRLCQCWWHSGFNGLIRTNMLKSSCPASSSWRPRQ